MKGTHRFATLGDLGPVPVRVVLPIEMLRVHRHNRPELLITNKRKTLSSTTAIINMTQRTDTSISNIVEIFHENEDDSDLIMIDKDSERQIPTLNMSEEEYYDATTINITDENAILEMERCLKIGQDAGMSFPGETWKRTDGIFLPEPPQNIIDQYSAVLGSPFHACHRLLTPAGHEYNKPFFVSLSEAIYAWDEDDMEILYESIKKRLDMNINKFKLMRYYRRKYFCKRVRRHILPPSKLYWRVRATFEIYGNKKDSDSGKPLFNNRIWSKVKTVL